MDGEWIELALTVAPEAAELAADFLSEITGSGVCTDNREVDTFSLDSLEPPQEVTVRAYLATDEGVEEKIEQVRRFIGNNPGLCRGDLSVTVVKQQDWSETWKAGFHTQRVGKRLVVKPSWEEFASGDRDLVIGIDPGMAFGTGTHATTRLCMEVIELICEGEGPYASPFPRSLLDVGTGSGILAIAGAKLGIERIVGLDIDPLAVEVAAENAALNGVAAALSLTTDGIEEITGEFDIVVANILAEELARLAEPLVARVAPGGWLCLSGILIEREPVVEEAFGRQGLQAVGISHGGEWSCMVYRKI